MGYILDICGRRRVRWKKHRVMGERMRVITRALDGEMVAALVRISGKRPERSSSHDTGLKGH